MPTTLPEFPMEFPCDFPPASPHPPARNHWSMGSQVTRVQNHNPKWNVMEHPSKNLASLVQKTNDTWNIMKYHDISWNIMKYHEISWNIMKYHEISWNICVGRWMSISYNSFNDMPGSKVMGLPPNHPVVDHDLIEIHWRRLGIHQDFGNPQLLPSGNGWRSYWWWFNGIL